MPDGPRIVNPMGHDFTGTTSRCPCGRTFWEHRDSPVRCRLAKSEYTTGRRVGSVADTEVARLRKSLGLTLAQVAEALDVSIRTVARVEHDLIGGRGRASHAVAEEMIAFLNREKASQERIQNGG